jgi:hypothetical protein
MAHYSQGHAMLFATPTKKRSSAQTGNPSRAINVEARHRGLLREPRCPILIMTIESKITPL